MEGDRVRVDIPDTTDPDHEEWHGREGVIVEVDKDDAGESTGDERDSVGYLIEFDNGETMHFRWRDVRPAFNDDSDEEEG